MYQGGSPAKQTTKEERLLLSFSEIHFLIDFFLSQVAVDRTSPNGLVVGIDVIPAQPPTGVSTIQGNFLSPAVQEEVKKFLRGARQGRHGRPSSFSAEADDGSWSEEELEANAQGYLEQGKQSIGLGPESLGECSSSSSSSLAAGKKGNASSSSRSSSSEDRMVDVVLSDMSAPWEQTEGFWKRSLSDPYYRMMNTSGINFRDHAGSMVCPHGTPNEFLAK